MNFIGISVICAALISVSMGVLGANYEKPAHTGKEVATEAAPSLD